ncbi:MAG TPA: single-stranded DNA-binding protein [Cellulomonas sp.]
MSTQSTLTVTGFVGSSVRFSVGKEGGVPYASFRLGSTQRIYDRAAQTFRDTPTQWYTVKVWRHVATNVVQSLRKGEPVMVTGRLRTEEWSGPEGTRTSVVIEATALGHDLAFGTTKFERTLAPGARTGAPDEDGPVDVSTLAEAPDEDGEPELDEDELDELDGAVHDELDELGHLEGGGADHDEVLVG